MSAAEFITSARSNGIIGLAVLAGLAFIAVPLTANTYVFDAILNPFLALALAALGLNLLTGFAGQVSLGASASGR